MNDHFEPDSFSYPLNEDMRVAYEAKSAYDKEPDNVMRHYELKKAIYNVSLTLKAMCATGELSRDVCCKVDDYFWKML